MAGGTDFHADIAFVRRSRLERVPTGANDVHFVIRGVNTSLHWSGILSGNYSIAKRPKKYELRRSSRCTRPAPDDHRVALTMLSKYKPPCAHWQHGGR